MKSIGFGLERIAWAALLWPRITAAIVLALLAIAGYGVTRLSFDADLRNTFASNSSAYEFYKQATAEFVDPENETIVLVEGDHLGDPDVFQRLQDFQFEMQVVDGVDSVYSLFALREAPNANGDAPPLVSDASAGLTPKLADRIRAHPVLGAKLLSADGKAMVFIVTPAQQKAPLEVARLLNTEIERTATEVLGDSGVTVTLTGFPTIRLGILDLLKRDQIVLNAVGAVIGFLMSLIAFRSLVGASLTAIPAIVAGLAVLGGMGLFGVKVTVMSNVIPALVMILGYADGMHLSHAWRKHRDQGKTPPEAEWLAQKEVGAACMLTALTVAGAFASLAITDIAVVRNFAWTGAVAMIVACPMVLIGHAIGAIAAGRFWAAGNGSTLDLLTRVERPSEALGRFVVSHSRTLGLISALLFVVLGFMYWNVPAEHSIREHLPKNNAANAALGRFDKEFGGAFPIQIVVPKTDLRATAPERLALIGRVQRAAASVDGTATPLSIWSLYEWLGGESNPQARSRLDAALEQVPPGTRSRFLGPGGEALVTVNVQEAPAHVVEARVAAIEAAVAAAAPNEHVAVTGVTVVLNREASRTIASLNWSLATAVFGDIILMIIAFRNIPIGIVSCLANTLPLFATGALLYLTGRGMQFTSVIALTVAFGIAVDDTIHYINRFLVLRGRDEPLDQRIIETSREVGPVLVGTTIIILAGLSTTFASGLPTVTLFGVIAGITLVVAALGDLIVMPALIAGYARRWFEKKATGSLASEPAA